MVFRLPSNLETIIPAPAQQRPQPPPWRGTFFVSGLRPSDRNNSQQMSVTAVEIDGEKSSQWPNAFHVRVLYEHTVLQEFETWMKMYMPTLPLCTFMPNRFRDTSQHDNNKANFRSLAAYLSSNSTIAIASWPTGTFPGAGIIIYPAPNTCAILGGVLFFESGFPDFIGHVPVPTSPISPVILQHPRQQPQYQPRILTGPYISPSLHRHDALLSPQHNTNPNSPVEQAIATHRSDGYRYIMQRSGQPGFPGYVPSSSTVGNWNEGEAVDPPAFGSISPTHPNPPFP